MTSLSQETTIRFRTRVARRVPEFSSRRAVKWRPSWLRSRSKSYSPLPFHFVLAGFLRCPTSHLRAVWCSALLFGDIGQRTLDYGSSRVNDAFFVVLTLRALLVKAEAGCVLFQTAHEIPLAIDQFFMSISEHKALLSCYLGIQVQDGNLLVPVNREFH